MSLHDQSVATFATIVPISFHLNGKLIRLTSDILPTTTLLDWLRDTVKLTGTKEGCSEGDCGACTVVLESSNGGRLAVNSCLLTLGQLHGRAVRTVEGLAGSDGAPHPVQTAINEFNGTQCGFCTPGIVMTAWAYAKHGGNPHEALAGNLCRCTGYKPILHAFQKIQADYDVDPQQIPQAASVIFSGGGQTFFRPTSLAELIALRAVHQDAWLLAGGTDLGIRIAADRENPAKVICLLDVAELGIVETDERGMRIGAAVPYSTLLAISESDPSFSPFATLLRRLGSRQIRSLGTLGGNLGTASPIGDALPPLIALGATVRIVGPAGNRVMPVQDFLVGYRLNALQTDSEVIRDIWIPRPEAGSLFACDKISRRFDQDITAVGLSALVKLHEGKIVSCRIAHGGVGPSAARASATELALEGAPFTEEQFDAAAQVLSLEIEPMTDLRATADYRRLVAGNLLRRMWLRWNMERTTR